MPPNPLKCQKKCRHNRAVPSAGQGPVGPGRPPVPCGPQPSNAFVVHASTLRAASPQPPALPPSRGTSRPLTRSPGCPDHPRQVLDNGGRGGGWRGRARRFYSRQFVVATRPLCSAGCLFIIYKHGLPIMRQCTKNAYTIVHSEEEVQRYARGEPPHVMPRPRGNVNKLTGA